MKHHACICCLFVYVVYYWTQLLRYIQDSKEQRRIAKSCHVDPTSGYLGIRKTVRRGLANLEIKAFVSFAHCTECIIAIQCFQCRWLPVMSASVLMVIWPLIRLNSTQSQFILHGTTWELILLVLLHQFHILATSTSSHWVTKWVEAVALPTKEAPCMQVWRMRFTMYSSYYIKCPLLGGSTVYFVPVTEYSPPPFFWSPEILCSGWTTLTNATY